MPHVRPPNPQEPPRTPAESQGRRLARQKSLPPSVSGLKSPEKPRFRQFFPCETTSRTLNRGRTSSVSGSIGPCVGSLNSQDTHHVRDTLGLPSIGTKVLRYSPVKLELGVNKSIGKTYGVSKMGYIRQLYNCNWHAIWAWGVSRFGNPRSVRFQRYRPPPSTLDGKSHYRGT